MNIDTLHALGLSVEDLRSRIVSQCVSVLLTESDEHALSESRFRAEIAQRCQESIRDKIDALAEEHLIPRVGEMIEKMKIRETNQFGEAKSPPMTLCEYIESRASAYMSEDVNFRGLSNAENRGEYNWKSEGPRLVVLMRNYIRETLEAHASAAVTDVNKAIAANIEKAAIAAIHATARALKVSVTA